MYDYNQTSPNHNDIYCLERLPCGYCKLLKERCPMQGNSTTITWNGKPPEVHLAEGDCING